MQKNESHLLVHWILYYIQIVGFENIIVLDNGSTDKINRKILKLFTEFGINIIYRYRDSEGFRNKGDVLSSISRLDGTDSKLMGLVDIDEFYYLNKNNTISFYPEDIYRELELLSGQLTDDEPIARIGPCFANTPGSYRVVKQPLKKVILLASYPNHIDGGQHLFSFSNNWDYAPGIGQYTFPRANIGILHFHYRHFDQQIKMTRDKLSIVIDVNDPAAIKGYNGIVKYQAHYLTITPDEYYTELNTRGGRSNLDIEDKWKACKLPYPYL